MAEYSDEMLKDMRLRELVGRLQRIYKRNPHLTDEAYIRTEYGVTQEYVLQLLLAQDLNCGLCKMSLEDYPARIDHDHKTQRVRGILCHDHNVWLGFHQQMVEQAFKYLRRTLKWPDNGAKL